MGFGAVSAAVGVVSTLGGMAEKKRQASIQQAQIAANQKAADASAALRKAEIDTARNYNEYQGNINALNRQQQLMQGQLGMQASNILTDLQTSQANFASEQGLLQTKQGAESQRGEANKQRASTEQQALSAKSASSAQSQQNQTSLKGAADEGVQALEEGERRRAVMTAILAATQGGNSRTGDVLISKDLEGDVAAALSQRLQLEGFSEADIAQLAYNKDIAEIARQLGIGSADFMTGNANRAESYATTLSSGSIADNTTSNKLTKQNSQVALQQLEGAMKSDANADKVNNILAEYGYASQQNAADVQLQQQRSSLNAQSASLGGGGLSNFAGILGAGLNAYSQMGGSFGGSRTQESTASNFGPTAGGNYSILSGSPYRYSGTFGSTGPSAPDYSSSILQMKF